MRCNMSLMIQYLSLLFSVPTWAAGRDCSISDGYIRGHLDNVTDICDQECGWLQCGDVCINSLHGNLCYCGEERLDLYGGSHYCCVDHSLDNRTQCSVDRYGYGSCPQGRVVSQRDTCNNHCFNDYGTSAVVGWWSLYLCGDHQCSVAPNICLGYPLCPDSRDVSECNEDLRCVLDPRVSHTKGVLVSDLSGGHHYCHYDKYLNDGEYDTITREDETDLNILSRKVKINYNSITECNTAGDQFNLPGLMCGEVCLKHSDWCMETPFSCGKYNFSTNNKQLCANTTFWAGKSCDTFYADDGDKAALGRRCTGAAQHCSYPWYTSSIYSFEVSLYMNQTFQNPFLFFV